MNVVALQPAELSELELHAQAEAEEAAERERIEQLDRFGELLEADKDKAVRWRAPKEQKWLENLRQKQGEQPRLGEVKGNPAVLSGKDRQPEHRVSHDNVTRPAIKQITARTKDMMFPTNERNWDAQPSPVAELVNPDEALLGPDGQPIMEQDEDGQPVPLTGAMLQKKVQALAEQKAGRMRQHLDDMLQEGEYAKHGRAVIDDMGDYGTGVLCGPIVRRVHQTTFKEYTLPDGTKIPEIKSKAKDTATLEHCDLWSFYPQPCRKIDEAEHAFVLHLLTTKKLRELAKQPGFDAQQVNRLLGMKPSLGALNDGGALVERDKILSPDMETMTGRYPVWRYVGPIPREALEAFGMEFDAEDHLTTIEGEVWFSQGIVLKAVPSTDENADRLPFYVICYEEDPSCVFGFGPADVLASDQYAVNQTWHAVMLNAMMSAGLQVGVVPGKMVPAKPGESVDVSCLKPKTWLMSDEVQDIKQVLTFTEAPNHTQALMAVYERAKLNALEHTLLPQFQEGAPTMAAKTASGLAMLMNSANIVQRDLAKAFDDEITLPALTALHRWYLLNGDDPDAKGDTKIIPKGESHLLIKDVQAQHVQILTQLAMDPRFAPYFDVYELLQLNLKVLTLPVEGILRDRAIVEEEQKKQAEQGPQDPETLKAQLQMQTVQAKIEHETAQQEREHKDREKDRLLKITLAEFEGDLAEVKLLGDQATAAEKIAAQERIAAGKTQLEQLKAGMKARLDAEKIAAGERQDQLEVQVEGPPRLA